MRFPWSVLRMICEGESVIDLKSLELTTEDQVHSFVATYGYDLFDREQLSDVWKFFSDACDFIESQICEAGEFPESMRQIKGRIDFKKIILEASGVAQEELAHIEHAAGWCCAVLRVMHVICHYENDLRLRYFSEIQKQTVDRFEAHLQSQKDSYFLGFESDKIPLYGFEIKPEKTRERALLKFLRSKETVAQQVSDYLGVRLVTHNRYDVVRVVSYLIDHHLISYSNLISSRSRNTLFLFDEVKGRLESGSETVDDSTLSLPAASGTANRFSSSDYRSLQFTVRHLVRIPEHSVSFFFPMEVQIMDRASLERAQKGDASHENYRKRQTEAVRQRVLAGIL